MRLSWDRRPRSIRQTAALAATALLAAMIGVALLPQAANAAGTVTYSATQTIPVPPASSYAGNSGGDGWAVALSDTSVFNVFHHNADTIVACHRQADASACWAPRAVTDGASHFSTSGHPGLSLDPSTGKLYVYVTRTSDLTGGVVCIDTAAAATNPNPFCGFVPLTAAHEAAAGTSLVSAPTQVGTRWYAFNYVPGAPVAGTRNTLMCFDLTSHAACAGQPITVGFGAGVLRDSAFPSALVTSIAGRVIVPVTVDAGEQLACFDPSAAASCAGAWPVPISGYDHGAAFPLLSAGGATIGLCLPTGADPCWNLAGQSVPTPAGLPAAVGPTAVWNGAAIAIGPRVYVPNGNANAVDCYDAATGASCASFPHVVPNLSLLYTVNPDPRRPDCLWVNADGGSGQIQNFDAFTAGGCGQGPIRVLASSFVVPTELCRPTSYTSLQVLDPARSTYDSGTVAFQDGDATPIPNAADRALDATGTADLTGLDLNTQTGLPQFLVTLAGPQGSPGAVTVKLTWTGTDDPSCVNPGTVVQRPPGQCGDAVFIAVPGAGQHATGPTDLASTPQLQSLFGSIRTTALLKRIGVRVVDTSTAPLGTLTDGLAGVQGASAADWSARARQVLAGNLPGYLAGADRNLAALRTTFAAVQSECAAGTPVVVAGYAQGAQAVHEFLTGLAASTDTAGKRAVLGAVLVADPERVPNSTVPEYAGALPRSSGVCDVVGTPRACTTALADVPQSFRAVTSSLCAQYDPVCETSHLVDQLGQNFANASGRTQLLAQATRAHASYTNALGTGVDGNLIGLRVALS